MLIDSAVVRSSSARTLFLTSAAVTIAVLWWAQGGVTRPGIYLSEIFSYLFAVLDQSAASVLLLILIIAVFVARRTWMRAVATWVATHTGVIATCTAVLLSIGALFVYHDHPLCMDEYAAYFQSQAFAAGHLAGRFPVALVDRLVPPAFQGHFLNVSHATGEVASTYWPSFALLLTPFTWLGIPWACNSAVSALTLLVVHRLALQLFEDRDAAGFAVLLTVASPVFLADGISYYSMSAHMLANSLYALLLLRPEPRKALVAGLVGSIALTLSNPVPHFLFALPWLLWVARQKDAPRLLTWLCAGYLPLCLLLGVGWFVFVHAVPHGGTGLLGGMRPLVDNANDPINSTFTVPTLDVLYARLIGLAKIWLWGVPGLVILACMGAWKLRHDVRCRLLTASAVTTLLGYLFVSFDQGHGWGFRYFHSAWFILPLLSAGALTRRGATEPGNDRWATEDVRAFVTACALLTLLLGAGHRATQINHFIADDLAELPHYAGTERHVVFVNDIGFYSLDLVQNDPWLRGNAIRMVSHGAAADSTLMREQFPQMHKIYQDPYGSVWADNLPRIDAANR